MLKRKGKLQFTGTPCHPNEEQANASPQRGSRRARMNANVHGTRIPGRRGTSYVSQNTAFRWCPWRAACRSTNRRCHLSGCGSFFEESGPCVALPAGGSLRETKSDGAKSCVRGKFGPATASKSCPQPPNHPTTQYRFTAVAGRDFEPWETRRALPE